VVGGLAFHSRHCTHDDDGLVYPPQTTNKVIDWPSFSPDLNPIENMWNKMRDFIQHEFMASEIHLLDG
jgi:hypothetical protein